MYRAPGVPEACGESPPSFPRVYNSATVTNLESDQMPRFEINTHADWSQYLAWADQQVCKCGKKFRERDKKEVWVTEYLCGTCGNYPTNKSEDGK